MFSRLFTFLWCLGAAAGCASVGPPESKSGAPDSNALALAELRDATRAFAAVDSAVAAGYPRAVKDCLVHEHHGAMGYHHVNTSYMDSVLDLRKPEILLYERLPTGEYRLNGVEFILPYQFLSRDSIAPRILGEPLRREDNLNFWYLHVWAWTPNPDGLFADFHPDIRCSEASSKVFRPSGTEKHDA